MATQVTTVRLTRGDASPWGFRLQGGKDWGLPLSVSKVNPGSLADSGGLKVGDIIVKICGQSAESIAHQDAQDVIVRAGNNLEITVAKGGTSTWKPQVTPVGNVPKPRPVSAIFEPQTVTKTSLAHSQPAPKPIGTSHNTTAAPFATFGTSTLPLVNKQFNSPINLYSMANIKETLEAHTEILAPGVKGINFMKPDAPVNTHSAVYQAILEEEAKSKGGSPVPQAPTGSGSPVPPRGGFPPHISHKATTRHVEAPITVPRPPGQEQQSQNVCAECGRLIIGVFCRINDKNLHAECFKCATCGNSLKNQGYFNINDKLYCEIHASQVARSNIRSSEPSAVPPPVVPMAPMASNAAPSAIPMSHPSGKTSPMVSAVSAMPWHTASSYHHVDAPASPVPGQVPAASGSSGFSLLSKAPAPFVPSQPMQQTRPVAPQPFYQTPVNGTQNQGPPGKFSWPQKSAGASFESQQSVQQQQSTQSMQQSMQMQSSSMSSSMQSSSMNETMTKSSASKTIFETSCTASNQQLATTDPSGPPGLMPNTEAGPSQSTNQPAAQPASPDDLAAKVLSQALPEAAAVVAKEAAPVRRDSIPATQTSCPTVSKPGPPTLPKPAQTNAVPTPWSAGPPPATSSSLQPKVTPPGPAAPSGPIPGPGKSLLPGLRQPPLRGRGQLKNSATPGTRIPICGVCQVPIRGPFIVAIGKTWCPDHFNCANNQCKRSLLDVGFVEEKGQLYCENCFKQYLAPNCSKCNVRIDGECLIALEKHWHSQCFCCSFCKCSLGKSTFFLEDGQPFCEKDWNELFTTKCISCGYPIEAGDRWVEALNNNYHSQCFKCTVCQKSLEGQSFFAKGGRPFCKAHAR